MICLIFFRKRNYSVNIICGKNLQFTELIFLLNGVWFTMNEAHLSSYMQFNEENTITGAWNK